jgi:hypothetical protein
MHRLYCKILQGILYIFIGRKEKEIERKTKQNTTKKKLFPLGTNPQHLPSAIMP